MSQSKTTHRERILVTVLPAALVLALYAFLFAMPAQKRHQAALTEYQSARLIAVDESVAEQARENLELARSGLERLKEQVRLDRDQISFLAKQWSNGEARLSTVQQVTELLQQFNLSIIRQEFEEEPTLSKYLQNLEDIVQQHSSDEGVLEYWQIELAGGYPDMLKFLNEIKTSGLRTFPVTLTMKASETRDGIHTWTLLFVV